MKVGARHETIKIMWPIPWKQSDVLDRLAGWLSERGYEVNRDRVDWRVAMYRKNERAWTQIYTGLTQRAKAPRDWLRVAGPEASALKPVQMGFYQGGEFA